MIAAVTVGVYMGWHTPELTTPVTRMQGMAIWEVLTFLLNALLFLLVGLQLPSVIDDIEGHTTGELIGWGLLISAVVIGVRLIWQFTVVYLIRAIDRREVQRARRAGWRHAPDRRLGGDARSGVARRGAGAAAEHRQRAPPFPERDLIIFLTFAVLFATLVGQGLTLGPLIRWLGVEDDGAEEREEVAARVRLAEAAIARVEELSGADWVREDTLERVRGLYDYRRRRFTAIGDGDGDGVRGAQRRLHPAHVRAVRRPARGADRAAQPAARSRTRCGGAWSATSTWRSRACALSAGGLQARRARRPAPGSRGTRSGSRKRAAPAIIAALSVHSSVGGTQTGTPSSLRRPPAAPSWPPRRRRSPAARGPRARARRASAP